MNPKVITIMIVFGMALIDTIDFPIIKAIHQGAFHQYWMVVPMLIYAFQPLLFYQALGFSNVTIINILWDIISDVTVTFVGLVFLKEKISYYSKIGFLLSIVAIYFFSMGELDV